MKKFSDLVLVVQEGLDRDFDACLISNGQEFILTYDDANALLNSRILKHMLLSSSCDMPYILEMRYKLYN